MQNKLISIILSILLLTFSGLGSQEVKETNDNSAKQPVNAKSSESKEAPLVSPKEVVNTVLPESYKSDHQ